MKAEHLAVARKKVQELRDWLDQQRPEQQRQQPSSRVLLLTGGWRLLHIMVGRIIPAAHVCWSGNTAFQLSVQLWLEHRSIRGFCCQHYPAGAPGSGKTTAVQVLAAELGFDLCEWQPAAVTSWEECEHSRQVCVVGRQMRCVARTVALANSFRQRSAPVWRLDAEAQPGCKSCTCGWLRSQNYIFYYQTRCFQQRKAAEAQTTHIAC